MDFSKGELQQYSRHLLLKEIGEEGQQKLKQSAVLVIGAGGLSCPILQYLAAAGIGKIGIIDGDKVEISNLQRQILFNYEDVGKYKSEVAAIKLSLLNPYIQLIPYTEMLDRDNALEIISEYDIVVDGSDNFPTRYLVNDAAVLTGKPLVFGSIFKFEGQVAVFNHQNGPSYRCLYPDPPEPGEVPNCSEIGVLGVLPGIIGCLQANEVLKIATETGSVLSGKLLTFNALNLEQSILKVAKNESIIITNLADNYELFCGIQADKNEVTWDDYQQSSSSYELLDVRTNIERARKNLGGVHIPIDQLIQKQKYLPKGKKVLVYCESGSRSSKAIETLQKIAPDKRFFNLKGGLISAEV